MTAQDPRTGLTVTHGRYVPFSHAHYAGDLVDGAYGLGLFGDVATELCIRTDGDEGLFASYSDVQFRAPVRAGDTLHITWTVVALTPKPARGGGIVTADCEARNQRGELVATAVGKMMVGEGA